MPNVFDEIEAEAQQPPQPEAKPTVFDEVEADLRRATIKPSPLEAEKLSQIQRGVYEPIGAFGPPNPDEILTTPLALGGAPLAVQQKIRDTLGISGLAEKVSEPLLKVVPELTREQMEGLAAIPAGLARQYLEEINPEGYGGLAERIAGAVPTERQVAVATGIEQSTAQFVNFFTSPLGIATLGTGSMPVAAQRAIAAAFTAQMISGAPEIARQLGEEFGKPEAERDPEKISKLVADGVLTTGFSALGGRNVVKGLNLRDLSSPVIERMPDVLDVGPTTWGAQPRPLPGATVIGNRFTMPATAAAAHLPAAQRPEDTIDREAPTAPAERTGLDLAAINEAIRQAPTAPASRFNLPPVQPRGDGLGLGERIVLPGGEVEIPANRAAKPKVMVEELVQRAPGEVDADTIASLSTEDTLRYFAANKRRGTGPQHDSVLAGMKMDPEDLHRLYFQRSYADQRMRKAAEAGNGDAYRAEMGKSIWFSGAIEGVLRKGPNYDAAMALERARANGHPNPADTLWTEPKPEPEKAEVVETPAEPTPPQPRHIADLRNHLGPKKLAVLPPELMAKVEKGLTDLAETFKRVKGQDAELYASDTGQLKFSHDPLAEALRDRATSLRAGIEVVANQLLAKGKKTFKPNRLQYGYDLIEKEAQRPIPSVLLRAPGDKIEWIAQFNPYGPESQGKPLSFAFEKPFTPEEAQAISALVRDGKIQFGDVVDGKQRYRIVGIEIPEWVEANWKDGKYVGRPIAAGGPTPPTTPEPPAPAAKFLDRTKDQWTEEYLWTLSAANREAVLRQAMQGLKEISGKTKLALNPGSNKTLAKAIHEIIDAREAARAKWEAQKKAAGLEMPADKAAYLKEYEALVKRVRAAEKEPDRVLTPEEQDLNQRDWKAFSRQRGYTEAEIADLDRLKWLYEQREQFGLTEEDLWALEPATALEDAVSKAFPDTTYEQVKLAIRAVAEAEYDKFTTPAEAVQKKFMQLAVEAKADFGPFAGIAEAKRLLELVKPEAKWQEGARGPYKGAYLDNSFAEAQKGYPQAVETLKGWSNEQLAKERAEMVKASLNAMFGHNAKAVLKLIEAEIEARKGPAPAAATEIPEPPKIEFEHPAPGSAEAEALEATAKAARDKSDKLHDAWQKARNEAQKAGYGTKRKAAAEKREEKLAEEINQHSKQTADVKLRSRLMYLEHLVQAGQPGQKWAAAAELLKQRADIIKKQADALMEKGEDKHAAYQLYDKAREMGKQAQAINTEGYKVLTEYAERKLRELGATAEEARSEAMQVANMQMSYPGMKSIAEVASAMNLIKAERLRKVIEGEADALKKEFGIAADTGLDRRVREALPDEKRARQILAEYREHYTKEKKAREAKEAEEAAKRKAKIEAEIEKAKTIAPTGKLQWWAAGTREDPYWAAVSGEPVKIDAVPDMEFFTTSRGRGDWSVVESSSGWPAGQGTTRVKAIENAGERIKGLGVEEFRKRVAAAAKTMPPKPNIGPTTAAKTPGEISEALYRNLQEAATAAYNRLGDGNEKLVNDLLEQSGLKEWADNDGAVEFAPKDLPTRLSMLIAKIEALKAPTTTPSPTPALEGLDKWLKVEVPEAGDHIEATKYADRQIKELEEKLAALQAESKALEPKIKSSRGWNKGRIKSSAKRGDVARWQELGREQGAVGTQIAAIRNASAKDRKVADLVANAAKVNDASLPVIERLGARLNMLALEGERIPRELADAFTAAVHKEIVARYPDATKVEIGEMEETVAHAVKTRLNLDEAFKTNPALNSLYPRRRIILETMIGRFDVPYHQFSKEARERISRYTQKDRPSEMWGKPVENLPAKELEELKTLIESETERVRKEVAEREAKRAAEEAAEKARENDLFEAAQKEADSLPKPGSTPKKGQPRPPTAKAVKEELIRRVEAVINEILGKSKIALDRNENGSYRAINSTDPDGPVAAVGDIEIVQTDEGPRYKAKVRRFIPVEEKNAQSATFETQQQAEWFIKAAALEAPGRAVIGVPGDGVFRINRSGPALLRTLIGARHIDIRPEGGANYTTRGAQKPPGEIRTDKQWEATKEFHGLEGKDTFYDWSPHLREFAERISPDVGVEPEKITVAQADEFVKQRMAKQAATNAKLAGETQAEPEAGGEGGQGANAAPPLGPAPAAPQPLPPKSLAQIIRDLSKGINIPIRFGRMRHVKYAGVFYKLANLVVSKRANDVPTVSHEIGHKLDAVFKFADNPLIQSELDVLGDPATPGSCSSWTKSKPRSYKLGEGVAEFVRYWLTNPTHARTVAPNMNTAFEAMMTANTDIEAVMHQAQSDIHAWKAAEPQARLRSHISTGDNPTKTRYTLSNLTRDVVDDLHFLRLAVDDVKKAGGSVNPSQNPYLLARLLRGSYGMADTFIRSGIVDFTSKSVRPGTSLEHALKLVAGDIANFRDYMVARRAKELQSQGKETGLVPSDVNYTFNALHNRPRFQETFDKIKAWSDGLLQYAVDAALVSEEGAAHMRRMNADYVPFHRVFEIGANETPAVEGAGTGRGLNVGKPGSLRGMHGSPRPIIDPLEALVRNAYTIITAAEKNGISVALANLSGRQDMGKWVELIAAPKELVRFDLKRVRKQLEAEGADLEDVPKDLLLTFWRPSGKAPFGENVIKVRAGDKTYFYRLNRDLFETFNALDAETSGKFIDFLAVPAQLLRSGVTLTPDFALSNMIRDTVSAAVVSRYGMIPFLSTLKGVARLLKGDDLVKQWAASGGRQSIEANYFDREKLQTFLRERIVRDLTPAERALVVVKNPLAALRYMTGLLEEATRVAQFETAYKELTGRGMPPGEARRLAAFEARDLQDFAKGGAHTKVIRRVAAFWNAQLQANVRLAQAFRERPLNTFAKGFAFVMMPKLIEQWINWDDPDYWDKPQWQRDLFYMIPVGKDENKRTEFLRIPIPFEVGLIFATLPGRFLQWRKQNEMKKWDLAKTLFLQTAPIPTSFPAVPFIETFMSGPQGYSWWRGRPIVPEALKGKPPEDQVTLQTSLTAKKVGNLLGMSPIKVDYLISGYTGGMGRQISHQISDRGISAVTGEERPALPVVPFGRFVATPAGAQSQTIDDFYRLLAEVEQDYQRFRANHPTRGLYGANTFMNNIATQLAQKRKLERQERDPVKRQRIDLEMVEIARRGVNEVKRRKEEK